MWKKKKKKKTEKRRRQLQFDFYIPRWLYLYVHSCKHPYFTVLPAGFDIYVTFARRWRHLLHAIKTNLHALRGGCTNRQLVDIPALINVIQRARCDVGCRSRAVVASVTGGSSLVSSARQCLKSVLVPYCGVRVEL